ncbi:MAG: ATP-binding protein [Nitrospinaceae bacterium]
MNLITVGGILFIALILQGLLTQKRWIILTATATGTLLTLLSLLGFPASARVWPDLLNHALILIGIGLTTVLCLIHQKREKKLRISHNLLAAIRLAQSRFIPDPNPRLLFEELQGKILSLTQSEFGFIGEIFYTEAGKPYVKTHAITNIAWNEETQKFYEKYIEIGMEFHNMDTLFGVVITTGNPVVSNSPSTDARSGGLPEGHPPLKSFLGLPFYFGTRLIGMVGMANRPGGYDGEWIAYLEPYLATCSHLIVAYRNEQQRALVLKQLEESKERYRIIYNQILSIVKGTSTATTGKKFFNSLVVHLASALNVKFAFLSVIIEENKDQMRTIAFFADGEIVENIEYEIRGTPCEQLVNGQTAAVFPDRIQERFPEDRSLKEWELESYMGVPVFDGSGNLAGLLGVMNNKPIPDVTNIQAILSIFAARAEAELQRMWAEEGLHVSSIKLEHSNRELQNFASIASHDLQEPLRKIIIFGDRLAISMTSDVSKARDYLERMQKSAGRMQQFIQDLLQFSRVTSRKKTFEPSNLNTIIDEVVENLETRIAQTRGTVNVSQLPTVEADPFQMRQLFQNLFSNSLKYHRGGVPPVVNVSSSPKENGSWKITVQDNGIGFDEKYTERIFKPFERLHGSTAYEGTGMGLAICKKIVDGHKGVITVKSQPRAGTTFTIYLPETQPAKQSIV